MGMLDIVKIPVFPKCVYNFSEIPLRIQEGFLWFSGSKLMWEVSVCSRIAKISLKKNKSPFHVCQGY